MNRVFKTIWNTALLTWVAVPEISKAHRGGACRRSRRRLKAAGQSPVRNLALVAFAALSGAALFAAPLAHATDFTTTRTVSDGLTHGLSAGDTITTNSTAVNVTNGTYNLLDAGNTVTVSGSGGSIYGLWANGANAVINSSNNAINNNSTGSSAHGVLAANSAHVVLTDTSVTTKGGNSYGLSAASGATITGSGSNTVQTFGGSSYGISANGANAAITLTGTTKITTIGTSSDGIYAGGTGHVQIDSATITTSGGNTSAVNASGSGSQISLGKVTATVTGNSSNTGGKGGLVTNSSGTITVTGNADLTTNGNYTTGIWANANSTIKVDGKATIRSNNSGGNGVYAKGKGAVVNLNTADIATTGWGNWGFLSEIGGVINVTGHTDLRTNGDEAYGANATGADTVSGDVSKVNLASVTMVLDGTNSDGLYANGKGIITVSGTADITTHGTNSHGATIENLGSDILLKGAGSSITTTGDGSHGIRVIKGATKTFDGATAGEILPAMQVSGNGSAVLNTSGAGSALTLAGGTALDMAMTAGPNTWGEKAESQSSIIMNGTSSTGGTALWITDGSALAVNDGSDAAGSRVKLDDTSTLTFTGTNNDIGSLESSSAVSQVVMGGALRDLVIGANNAAATAA
ncbi:MAG: ESPR-type extended signal peptide-containing protein [Desulfocapsaceae bacterium]|nr:ESPR-type extended signal peptide-containing protein [Desulfocapsaceae bacterium]